MSAVLDAHATTLTLLVQQTSFAANEVNKSLVFISGLAIRWMCLPEPLVDGQT
jgi:hypothetical protein